MNITLHYSNLKNEHDEAKEVVRLMVYQLRTVVQKFNRIGEEEISVEYPSADEWSAALQRRAETKAAAMEAWDVVPEAVKKQLKTPIW